MELRHANNAARQDAINELIATANELHMSIAENPEIARIAAIAASNDQPEPGELEFHQLRHFSWHYHNTIILLDATFREGQMPQEEYAYWVADVAATTEMWPGMIPHLKFAMRNSLQVSGGSFEELLAEYGEDDVLTGYEVLLKAVIDNQ